MNNIYFNSNNELNDYDNCSDILDTILDTVNEWVVITDKNGIITMLSKSYREFLNIENPIGKHVTEVIENTRLHKVIESGVSEIGEIQEIRGRKMIVMRIPIIRDGKVVGAIGKGMFKDINDFLSLSEKIKRLENEIVHYKNEIAKDKTAKYSFEDFKGSSIKIKELKKISKKIAMSDSNILILGESGTGKELLAHAIHNTSNRRNRPFIRINCAAIPGELLESELFGYEEGAFTGAKKGGKKGKFELADKGTILLDEIGEMPLFMQAKLLRVIQEKEVERLGSNTLEKIDVRIIASTNKDLELLVRENKFREDLYYRLNVITIRIPPLRERIEDIEELSITLKNKVSKRLGIYVEGISKEVMDIFKSYEWPGNIRELENVIERAINLLESDLIIKPEHLPNKMTKRNKKSYFKGKSSLKDTIEEIEKDIIINTLKSTKGNKNKAAKILGLSRMGLYKKIERYNIKNIK